MTAPGRSASRPTARRPPGASGSSAPTCCRPSTPTRSWPAGGVPCCCRRPRRDPARGRGGRAGLDGLVVSRRRRRRPGALRRSSRTTATAGWRADRDAWELALLDAADGARPPGARRLPRHAGDGGRTPAARSTSTCPTWSATTSTPPAATSSATIAVRTVPGTRLAALLGADGGGALPPPPVGARRTRASRHGAAPTTARSRRWRRPGDRFRVGVQWHPEMGRDQALFSGAGRRGRRAALTQGTNGPRSGYSCHDLTRGRDHCRAPCQPRPPPGRRRGAHGRPARRAERRGELDRRRRARTSAAAPRSRGTACSRPSGTTGRQRRPTDEPGRLGPLNALPPPSRRAGSWRATAAWWSSTSR